MRSYLHFAIAVSGASILAIEILGTRIVGPFYGVDIFLWSTLITITLGALAVGYWLGGRWADRRPSFKRFAAIFAAGGAWIAAIPLMRGAVIAAAHPLERSTAMFASSFALFFPPLAILGMVSPYALKLRANSPGEVGRSAGDLYAISTIASVAAALLTGFVLVPSFGVRGLAAAIGVLLIATAAIGLLGKAKSPTAQAPLASTETARPAPGEAGEATVPRWYVYLAVAIGGACGLAVEILGTRLLAPYYGASLYLWSALIAATLLALSIGYLLGGRWADRGPSLHRFCLLFAGAGLWVAAIPWIRHPIFGATESLGLRGAVLVSSAVLFMPPLVLLGMTTPYAVRIATANLGVLGRVTGKLYALSTVAGMAASLGTGLVLVHAAGTERLTFGVGVLLVAVALVGAALVKRRMAPAIVMLVAAVAAGASIDPRSERVDPAAGLLAIEETPYGEIRVVTMDDLRIMLIDGMIHTEVDTLSLGSPSDYVNVLDLPGGMFREPGKMLLVGLGGGAIARRYTRSGWSVDAVEIDPEVTRTARTWFGLEPSDARVFHMDGREFLAEGDTLYDLIIVDAFGSGSIPFHLVTKEAFALFKRRLTPDGVIALNVIAVGWHDTLVRSLAATLGIEFARVTVLPMAEPPDQLGNLIIIASNRDLALLQEPPVPFDRFSPEYHRAHAWDNRFAVDPRGVRVITDDLNPVDLWAEHINLETRKGLHEYFAGRSLGW